jgi:hypothetical protein
MSQFQDNNIIHGYLKDIRGTTGKFGKKNLKKKYIHPKKTVSLLVSPCSPRLLLMARIPMWRRPGKEIFNIETIPSTNQKLTMK